MLNEQDIFGAIKSEINYCESKRLSHNPSITPTEMQRLDLIDRYMSSRYRDGDQDAFGNQMVFYNIVSFPVDFSSKMIDFDPKDIKLLAQDDRYWETWLMEKELTFWMDEKQFGGFLNNVALRLPRDGHVMAKKVDDRVELVPLKNLRFRPDALSLDKTPIIEKYEYQIDEFIKEAKDRGWQNWQEVSMVTDYHSNGFLNNGEKVIVFGCWFPEGYLGTESNYFIVSYDGHILADWSQEIFYKDLAWEKKIGRLLGVGVVEKLFNEQVYLNRIGNYKADGLNWTSKHLFQTRDNSFKTNLLGNSDNGDIFIVNDPLEPVQMEERNLSFYEQEEQRWENQAKKRTFATEPLIGSRTSQSSIMIQIQMMQKYFDQKKEYMAIFIKEILEDWVMPDFIKDKRGSHTLMMKSILTSDKGSEKLFNLQLNYLVNKQKLTKFLPPEMWDIKKALLGEQLKSSSFKLPRGFYDDLKYKMRLVMGNETIDTAGRSTFLQTLMQIIGSNPAVLQNPVTKQIIFKMMDLNGFNPKDFEDETIQSVQDVSQNMQAQRGGSISAPAQTGASQQVPVQTSV